MPSVVTLSGAPAFENIESKPPQNIIAETIMCNWNFLLVSCAVVSDEPAASNCLSSSIGVPQLGHGTALSDTVVFTQDNLPKPFHKSILFIFLKNNKFKVTNIKPQL